MEKRVYRPLEEYDDMEIARILREGTEVELAVLPFAVGTYVPKWKKAQDICVKLMECQEPFVRANAAMGFAYIARTKGRLEKQIVKPLLMKELRENTAYQGQIVDAIEDINQFLKWNLAKKAVSKIEK